MLVTKPVKAYWAKFRLHWQNMIFAIRRKTCKVRLLNWSNQIISTVSINKYYQSNNDQKCLCLQKDDILANCTLTMFAELTMLLLNWLSRKWVATWAGRRLNNIRLFDTICKVENIVKFWKYLPVWALERFHVHFFITSLELPQKV